MATEFDTNNSQEWENIYIEGDTGWDLGGPTPVFVDTAKDLKPANICVLGCGNGYDAIMFSQRGFNVTAVDFAPSPINFINKKALDLSLSINTIQENIFSLTPEYNHQFDYILEQTCFCAINPDNRKKYHNLVSNLLKPGGLIIGLWYPLDKKLSDGGPAFGVSENEIKMLFNHGWEILEERFPENSVEARAGREKLIIFKRV